MNTVTLPDGPSLPRFVQGGIAIVAPLWMMRRLHERYGSAFKIVDDAPAARALRFRLQDQRPDLRGRRRDQRPGRGQAVVCPP